LDGPAVDGNPRGIGPLLEEARAKLLLLLRPFPVGL
jgi:hypothetical protein